MKNTRKLSKIVKMVLLQPSLVSKLEMLQIFNNVNIFLWRFYFIESCIPSDSKLIKLCPSCQDIILRNLQKTSLIFGNVQEHLSGLQTNFVDSSQIFRMWLEIFGKSPKPLNVNVLRKIT